MSSTLDDKLAFTRSHTPRQIAEERGWYFVREAYQEYYWRKRHKFNFSLNPSDYYDSVPDFDTEEEKLAFVSVCAAKYVDEFHLQDEDEY